MLQCQSAAQARSHLVEVTPTLPQIPSQISNFNATPPQQPRLRLLLFSILLLQNSYRARLYFVAVTILHRLHHHQYSNSCIPCMPGCLFSGRYVLHRFNFFHLVVTFYSSYFFLFIFSRLQFLIVCSHCKRVSNALYF
jgi:hypothetical protein